MPLGAAAASACRLAHSTAPVPSTPPTNPLRVRSFMLIPVEFVQLCWGSVAAPCRASNRGRNVACGVQEGNCRPVHTPRSPDAGPRRQKVRCVAIQGEPRPYDRRCGNLAARVALPVKLYIKVVMLLCAVFVAYGVVDYTIQRDVI